MHQNWLSKIVRWSTAGCCQSLCNFNLKLESECCRMISWWWQEHLCSQVSRSAWICFLWSDWRVSQLTSLHFQPALSLSLLRFVGIGISQKEKRSGRAGSHHRWIAISNFKASCWVPQYRWEARGDEVWGGEWKSMKEKLETHNLLFLRWWSMLDYGRDSKSTDRCKQIPFKIK